MENVVRIDSAKIDDIWKNHIKNPDELNPRDKIEDRGYHIEKELPKGGILFLGMNPSYPKGTEDDTKKRTYIRKKDKDTFVYGDSYHVTEKSDGNYWNKLLETAEKLGESQLCHHDLFFVRERNQATVLNLIDDAAWKKFFNEQLQMSEEIVKAADPRIIVVVNAGVSNLIKAKHVFGFNPTPYWWEKLGVDMLQINGKNTPILFTGMLTGRRAIDNGTYNSLMWHINYVLQNENQYR